MMKIMEYTKQNYKRFNELPQGADVCMKNLTNIST